MNDGLRPEVMAFAQAMEAALKMKDPERGTSWKQMDALELCGGLEDNFQELHLATQASVAYEVLPLAVNVANYAMMVADVCKALYYPGEPCWLCGVADGVAITTIKVARDTPHGPECEPKDVQVHPGCYQDMDA